PEVRPVLCRREQIVTRNDRAVRTQTLTEIGAETAHVTTVGVRQSDARREEVQCAHLEAAADLPDAVQHHAMPLIVGRNAPLAAEVRLGCERHWFKAAEWVRVSVIEA